MSINVVGIESGGSGCSPAMSLAGVPITGQVVSGVKAASAWSAALARNVRRRVPIWRPGSQALKVARGSVPRQRTEGTEYRRGARWRTGP